MVMHHAMHNRVPPVGVGTEIVRFYQFLGTKKSRYIVIYSIYFILIENSLLKHHGVEKIIRTK